jgi:5'-deoxynucleotidase YfbR-like HD superfamily hydrolase
MNILSDLHVIPNGENHDPLRKFELSMRALRVKRFHCYQTIGEQTVGEHTARVMMILLALEPNPSANLLQAALYHDVPEWFTGDIPSPAKWQFPKLKKMLTEIENRFCQYWQINYNLTDEETKTLFYADQLEMLCYVIDQLTLGSRELNTVFSPVRRRIYEKYGEPPPAVERLGIHLTNRYLSLGGTL